MFERKIKTKILETKEKKKFRNSKFEKIDLRMDREQSIPPKSSEIATNEQEINANNCSGEIDIDNDYIRFLDRTTKTLMLMKDDDVGFDLELNRIIHGERDDHNDPNQNNALGCDEQFPLPKSLIITNMDYRIFDPSSKERV